jgi:hypothetical protein
MPINFPTSPASQEIYSFGGFSWQWDGASWVSVGQTTVEMTKSFTLPSPTNTDNVTVFYASKALTITKILSIVKGTSPSVTFSIRYGTDRSASGTEVVTSGITCTSTTTGVSTTSFNNATIPISNFVWLTVSATSGTVDELGVSIIF